MVGRRTARDTAEALSGSQRRGVHCHRRIVIRDGCVADLAELAGAPTGDSPVGAQRQVVHHPGGHGHHLLAI